LGPNKGLKLAIKPTIVEPLPGHMNWLVRTPSKGKCLKLKAESLKQKGNAISIMNLLARKNNPVIN